MKLWPLGVKFQRFVVGHFSYFKWVKLQLPSVPMTCMSWKRHGFWNLFICKVWITSNGSVALRVEGVEKENIAPNLRLLFFKTKDPPTTSCFLKWGLSHSLGYGVHLHFFKWRIWNFFYDCCVENFTLWWCFLLSLWSHYVFAYKLFDILQTFTTSWHAKSMKKFGNPLPTTLEF